MKNLLFTVFRITTLASLIFACLPMPTQAAVVLTDWNSFDATTATGALGAVSVTGSIQSGAPFSGIVTDHFSSPSSTPSWDTTMPLPQSAEGIVLIGSFQSGTQHSFSLSSPLPSVLLYLADYDFMSEAIVTANPGVTIELVASGPALTFDTSTGLLVSGTAGENGDDDAVLQLTGNVESISLQYTNGVVSNGVAYTLVTSVPEPSAALLLGVIAVVLGLRSYVGRSS